MKHDEFQFSTTDLDSDRCHGQIETMRCEKRRLRISCPCGALSLDSVLDQDDELSFLDESLSFQVLRKGIT